MAAKHWLTGCGLGCAAVVLIFVLLGVAGTVFVRDTVKGFSAAADTRVEIDERFGTVAEFTPPADGAVSPDRMEAFLAVRETVTPAREAVVRSFSGIPLTEEEARELEAKSFFGKARSIFGIVGSAAGLGSHIGTFFEVRNRAMLEQGIGMGEYTYIYVLGYYSWLDRSPGDGPEDAHVEVGSGNVQIRPGRGGTPPGLDQLGSSRIASDLRSQLRNQLGALPDDSDDEWLEALVAEIEAVERDPDRIPWQDGLPDAIRESFEPYRDRLVATYEPMTNPFELLRNRRQGGLSIQAE